MDLIEQATTAYEQRYMIRVGVSRSIKTFVNSARTDRKNQIIIYELMNVLDMVTAL